MSDEDTSDEDGEPLPGDGGQMSAEELLEEIREFDDVPQAIREGKVDLVISRDLETLQTAVEENVTYYSTAPSVQAALEALKARNEPLDVAAVTERPRDGRRWGIPERGREELTE